MKKFSKKELVLLSFSFLLVVLTGFVMINQFTLQKHVAEINKEKNSTVPEISWFEQTQAYTTEKDLYEVVNQPESTSSLKQGRTYVINKSSKKIHSPDCKFAQNMKDDNKEVIVTDNLDEFLDKGYSICSVCGAQ